MLIAPVPHGEILTADDVHDAGARLIHAKAEPRPGL